MKNTVNSTWRGAFAAIAFLSALLVGPATAASASDDELGEAVGSIAVPAEVSHAEVKDAIVMALNGREWGVKSQTDERIVGYLKHRSNEAKVTFLYNTSKIDMFCVGWAINKKTGERKKPELPRGWLKNLQSDITKYFNRVATTK